jgi:hypothetical protein
MRLIVDGLDPTIPRFRYLWGHHVVGFRPYTHCRRCFVGRDERNVRPTMADGEYELESRGELFYLCGVGFAPLTLSRSFLIGQLICSNKR